MVLLCTCLEMSLKNESAHAAGEETEAEKSGDSSKVGERDRECCAELQPGGPNQQAALPLTHTQVGRSSERSQAASLS